MVVLTQENHTADNHFSSMRGGGGLVRGLQERAAQAFPAVILEHLGGWWLRYADSGAWWASSVLPHGDAAPSDLPGKIESVETFYARHGTRARFQISPGAAPAGLDEALAARGYRADSPMSLQSAPNGSVTEPPARRRTADPAGRPADGRVVRDVAGGSRHRR